MGYTNVAHYPAGKQGWMEAGFQWRRLLRESLRVYAALFFFRTRPFFRKPASHIGGKISGISR